MFFNATIYGGSFDPVQEGHLQVVQTLHAEAKGVADALTVIAPTARNPWKTTRELTRLELRLEMWQLALDAAGIPWSRAPEVGKVLLADFPCEFSAEFIVWWRATFQGTAQWTISSDSSGSELRWKDWAPLAVPMKVMPIVIDVHATAVREGIHPPLPAIRQFIRAHGLFPKARWE